MIELNHLRHFYEVAKAGSFTAAARNLRVSQSALSKTVALLEAREGVQLLQRSKTGVVLTPLGTQVFEQAEGIFDTVASIQTTFRNHKEICEGILRIGASDHITNYLLAPEVGPMQRRYPKLLTSIFAGTPVEVADLILKDKLEFGLSFTKVSHAQGLIFEPIRDMEMAVVYRPDLPGAAKIKTKADLLKTYSYIASVRTNPKQNVSPELLEVLGEMPPIACEASSQESQKRMCLAGVGFAYLARFMVEEEIKQKTLAELPFKQPPTLTIYLTRKKASPLSYNARVFLKEAGLTEAK